MLYDLFRCAICQMCGNNNPGVNSTWFNNYSLCGPCHSLGVCLLCEDNYEGKHYFLVVKFLGNIDKKDVILLILVSHNIFSFI